MNNIDIIKNVMQEKAGFKVKQQLAGDFVNNYTIKECFEQANLFLNSNEYQIRVFGTFILGNIAGELKDAIDILKNKVGIDDNWRVQETLAMAFEKLYISKGYEKSFPIALEWLSDKNPNLRRAITEGLRIWINHEYFKEHPKEAVSLLSKFKSDESEYVRKSVGNALKDIGKKYKELILSETSQWDLTNNKIKQTYKHAMRLINKEER